ncbi:hypothetical protein C8R46DRAFT_1077975 [Mycena filopes]|nr:hypothetical protein C8R46DRAFT_1077975 [Mycena filopes]
MAGLEASRPESLYTVSTVPSTVWGPGTVAGRVILALGEATLKGIDRIVDLEARAIQSRLAVIRRQVPGNLPPVMYDDLAEMSRAHAYPQIMEEALQIMWLQIERGYAKAVASSLSQLWQSELEWVICWIVHFSQYGLFGRIYEAATPMEQALNFLSILVQVRPAAAGACFAALDHLFLNPRFCKVFVHLCQHPILTIYGEERANIPLLCRTPLSTLQLTHSANLRTRWDNWLNNTGQSIEDRLLNTSAALVSTGSDDWPWVSDFWDAAYDLFDIIRYSMTPQHHRAAADQLIACLANSLTWEPLRMVLDLVSRFPSGSQVDKHSGYISPSLATLLGYGPYISDISASRPEDPSLPFDPQLCAFLRYAHLRSDRPPPGSGVDTALSESAKTKTFAPQERLQAQKQIEDEPLYASSSYFEHQLETIPEVNEAEDEAPLYPTPF